MGRCNTDLNGRSELRKEAHGVGGAARVQDLEAVVDRRREARRPHRLPL